MPNINIVIEMIDERGNVEEGIYRDLLFADIIAPLFEDISFPYLRFIEPYGLTYFNRLQAGALVDELRRLRERALSMEE